MNRITGIKLNRNASIATVLTLLLLAVAGVLLWAASVADPVQAEPPDGFEYGNRTVFPNVTMIEGNSTQTATRRVPLHATLQLEINGQTAAGNASVTHATISASLSNDNLSLKRGIDPSNRPNTNLTGTTDGVDHILFLAEKLGTTTVTLTPVGGSPPNWANTSMTVTVEVYEPTVKTEDLNMPATVTLNEGDRRDIPIDWVGSAESLVLRDDVTMFAAIAPVGASNPDISVQLTGTKGNGYVRITANADADTDDETAEYQLYFASNRARPNGKYEQTLTVIVNDTTVPPTATPVPEGPAPTATPTPVPKATDATLSALSLGSVTLSPVFASGTTAYTAEVDNDVSQISVTATATDSNAETAVRIGGSVDSDGTVPLAVGVNSITVQVTAEDGQTVQTYTVFITRAALVSEDGDASTVCLDGNSDARQECLLREVLNELKKANAPTTTTTN